MNKGLPPLFTNIGALLLIAGAIFFLTRSIELNSPHISYQATTSVSSAAESFTEVPASTTAEASATSTAAAVPHAATTTVHKSKEQKPAVKSQRDNEVRRIEDPYPLPPDSFSVINEKTRHALVNILCMPHGGSLRPISASGVIVDPRGVILPNAHVAQYVLLSHDPRIDLSCV